MNPPRPHSRARLLPAFALMLSLFTVPAQAAEGTIISKDTSQILPNVTYTNTVAEHSGGRVESFTLAASPDSTLYPISIQGSGYIYGGGNMQSAVAKAEALGYNVIGGINSDYFSLSHGVPMGIVIEDGVYKSSPGTHSSILFNGTQTTVVGPTAVATTLYNNRSGQTTTIHHYNKHRADTGGLYLYNSYFSASTTKTSTEGIMVRMIPAEGSANPALTVNSTLSLQVVEVIETSYAWDIGPNDYILTAANESGYQHVLQDFNPGDIITLKTQTDHGDLSRAQWASGGGDIMIQNGSLTDSSSWVHASEGRAPRTAFGVKADGTLVYYAVDGRQSGYSAGLSQRELANHLLEEGCTWAVNLDGGGSTSFTLASYTAPHVFASPSLINSPSDGRMRSCATFLLFVDPQIPSQISLEFEQSTALIGSQLTLGSIYLRDVNDTILKQLADTTLVTQENLGSLSSQSDSQGYPVYSYTPLYPGFESFYLTTASYDFTDTQTLEIVDTLSDLHIVLQDTTSPLTEYQVSKNQKVDFDVVAKLYGTDVFANGSSLTWSLQPGLDVDPTQSYGTVTADGVFVAGTQDAILTVTGGGRTTTLPITVRTMFDDVPDLHWAFDAIEYLRDNEIIGGVSQTEFGLGQQIRRGDFAVMLYVALGSPQVHSYPVFDDVKLTDYFANAVAWSVENEISAGMGDGTYGVEASITREQAMTILYRVAESFGVQLPATSYSVLGQYSDAEAISDYARPAIASLTGQKILTDSTTNLRPQEYLVRESMALYLYHLLTAQPEALPTPSQLTLYPSEISLTPGGRSNLIALVEPAGSGAVVTWTTSDPSAVTVSNTGTVTNVFTGTGQPIVTVTARSGNLSATCIVRCVPAGTEISPIPPLELFPGADDDLELPETELPTTPEPETPTPEPEVTPPTTQPTGTTTGLVIDAPGGLNVRVGPLASASVVTLLPQSTIVNVHSRTDDGWLQISCQIYSAETEMTSNIQGYVMQQYIQERAITATVYDAENGLNLRSGAGTAFSVVAKIPDGTQVTIQQAYTGWYKISVNISGQTHQGFVASEFLRLNP